jgi:predicted aldo/keto reductase-like oxidoreductase
VIRTGLAAGALAALGELPLHAETAAETQAGSQTVTQGAASQVMLGRSGVKATRLAFGTGSFSGEVQRGVGQESFNRLVRHAYDHGVRFFETAESYDDMHRMLGIALKGIPRESYVLMSKMNTFGDADPLARIDELRSLAQTEYFDIMLLHWQHESDWPQSSKRWQDGIAEAQHRKAVVSRGASVHGLPALRQVPGNQWLQVAMIRCNHKGSHMDAENYRSNGPGNVDEVVEHIKQVRAQGMGVVSMKLVGEGSFDREDRAKAMRFAFRNAGVDAVTVGYKSTAEIDEAIDNVNRAFV